MTRMSRRQFAALAGGALALPAIGTGFAGAAPAPRVVVIGGGFGGATFAKYLRRAMGSVKITLVEPKSSYVLPTPCPLKTMLPLHWWPTREYPYLPSRERTMRPITITSCPP